jgi:flavodoxin
MRAIIIYNTATGNTRQIAIKMKEILENHNHTCDLYRDKEIKDEIKVNPQYFNSYDLFCLGSCTHGNKPAKSFIKFMSTMENYDLVGKSLVCFSSSLGPEGWQETCKEIKEKFPDMNHIGNFGCVSKNYNSTIRNFEELVKKLN